ncbi:MAG: IS4 family transposase [Candidatus Cloacimonetes bacterium]|nr:IS4 family transposase [Candidatus Cloacimonadota bacterium]
MFYADYNYKKYKQFRLLAVDGTKINIPLTKENRENSKTTKTKENNKEYISVRASIFYDVLNNMIIDSIIGNTHTSEKELLISHLKFLKQGDLLLTDRGYPSYYIFNMILETGADFCIRVKKTHNKVIEKFVNSDKIDDIIEINPSSRSDDIYHKPLKVRVLKIFNKDNDFKILCTSLIGEEYSYDFFIGLYELRWQVEEEYKNLKCKIQLENFSGKTTLSVLQDF